MTEKTTKACPLCGCVHSANTLDEVNWLDPEILARFTQKNSGWKREEGACPACVQQGLLQVLLAHGEEALHESIQAVWPLDAEAAFGALPTPLRLHADPRFSGKGVTIAMVDSGFYPHPDLVQPRNRIRAWVDASRTEIEERFFTPDESPEWPGWDAAASSQWHGLMTSTVAAGNGRLSHGLYRGLASDAELVLIQVLDEDMAISNESITRALKWLQKHADNLKVRVVNLSLGGDPVSPLAGNPVDQAVAALVKQNISVVVAAGNNGERRLVPPATSPKSLTIGGLDDKNTFGHEDNELWHSNYGMAAGGAIKPELVAPSIWIAAPILPGTEVAEEAKNLFAVRHVGGEEIEARIAELKLVTPFYQHVDGTSFAAPLTSSTIACMLEANPDLTPEQIRDILVTTAHPIPDVPSERQGAGALDSGQAVAAALQERHRNSPELLKSPRITPEGVIFALHDPHAQKVEVLGSWNQWFAPGIEAEAVEPGIWQTKPMKLSPGKYVYKFLVDGRLWLDDYANPAKIHDDFGAFNSVLRVTKS